MDRPARLLVVEDHPELRENLARGLRATGYTVDLAGDGTAGLAAAQEAAHDLLILDRMLPGLDGLELLRRLRRAGSAVPVLLLTARDSVQDRVDGLDAGADDYLPKPFAAEELLARVRALLRRGSKRADPVVQIGDLEVDTTARLARRGNRRLDLTAREFALLDRLVERPDQVVSSTELVDLLYGADGEEQRNALAVLVGRLRRKLDPDGKAPLLHTRRGFGYVLSATAP